MEILKNVLTILSIIGIPSLVTAFLFGRVIKRLDDDKKARDEHMCLLIGLSYASVELSEATAIAYKNQRCNGEITAALEKTKKTKEQYSDFVSKRCITSL
jgi:ABC-type enterochelin transport system permease subunit